MTENRFDELSKVIGARASRRSVLKAALGVAAGGLLSRFGRDETVAESTPAVAPATDTFQRTWARTDKPVADGMTNRTWMWGPEAFTEAVSEPYDEAPGGSRTVQYFDKARMEDNAFRADGPPWDVTNGLLVVELISGRMQLGDSQFEDRQPAQINVAGDSNDPNGPTYATFGTVLDAPPAQAGTTISQRIDRAGVVSDDPGLTGQGVNVAITDDVTNHSIAAPFWEFMNSSGVVHQDGQFITDQLFDSPYFATGRPISEAYWADVLVGGTQRLVLMQCFERRCLTYTPGNPEGYVVEAGNVGQHYHAWRATPQQSVSIENASSEVEAALANAAEGDFQYQQLVAYLTAQGFSAVRQSATSVSGAGLVTTDLLSAEFESVPPNPLTAAITFDPLSDDVALVYATVTTSAGNFLYILYADLDSEVTALFPTPELAGLDASGPQLEGSTFCDNCVDACASLPLRELEETFGFKKSCKEVAAIICESAFPGRVFGDHLPGSDPLVQCVVNVAVSCFGESVRTSCATVCASACPRGCEFCSSDDPTNFCCAGRCTDVTTDGNNCGSCGKRCAPGQACCGGSCIDILSNAANCSACGNPCPNGHDCINGVCTPPATNPCADCTGNDVANFCCDGVCMDLRSDPNNCGTCGLDCFPGQICCNGICLDPMDDDQNCGGCGIVCGPEEDCIGGVCAEPGPCADCLSFESCCEDMCVDLQSNDDHCGACGIECAAGHECIEGICVREPECQNNSDCFGCDVCIDGMCVDCPGTCCDDGTCVPNDVCCPGLIDCGFGLCCGGNYPICCTGGSYCCSAQYPNCCGDGSCCSPGNPVCCSDGWCCPAGCYCTGNQSCSCPGGAVLSGEAAFQGDGFTSGANPGISLW